FVAYQYNVKHLLKEKNNLLRVILKSPTKKAREEIEKYKINLNTGHDDIPGVPYLRKAQYSHGWDWGPKLPDIGIWQSVRLIGYDNLRILSVYPEYKFTYLKDPLKLKDLNEISSNGVESVNIKLNIELDTNSETIQNRGYEVQAELKAPDGRIFKKNQQVTSNIESITFDIEYPYLWWTHDLGIPNLYELKTSLLKENVIEEYFQKIGIRDIRLIRNPDKWGETFYFLLNGVPIFAKGANWIPIDSFIPRGKKMGLYSRNLEYAKMANMNMIRVWGGGIYEDDSFYETCDKLGILVWQDFPFACAVYPPYKEFIDLLEIEFIQNIKRLRRHPSLALWCGNNEVECLWRSLLYNCGISDPQIIAEYKKGYIKIFEVDLPELIKKYDPSHPYWPSSPSNGFVGDNLGSVHSSLPDKGDSHYWAVWHENKHFTAYRKFNSRFMSEFGFESFPSLKTIEAFCPKNQFDFYSPIMENHQKNFAGNKKIMRYMQRRFSIPSNFERQIILSQITQAEAMEYGVEHWRRNRNEYHCMGSLYWQLNDCWPVASWSSIDYFGRWKALHYFAKRFYQSIFPSVKESKDEIEFWLTNDLKTTFEGIFEWRLWNSENKLLMEGSFDSKIPPCCSINLGTVKINNKEEIKANLHNTVIFYKLRDNQSNRNSIFNGFRLFDAPKRFDIKNPELTFEPVDISDNLDDIILKIISKKIAFFVYIDSNLFDFISSDNIFSMEPNEMRIVNLKNIKLKDSENKFSKDDVLKNIKIRSLYDLLNDKD
ncbi:MAG: glycoside hydrolase family 2 protein, partial [Candidatus Hodarchaeota archaeon]